MSRAEDIFQKLIYFGEDAIDKDEAVKEQMLKFIGAALGAEN